CRTCRNPGCRARPPAACSRRRQPSGKTPSPPAWLRPRRRIRQAIAASGRQFRSKRRPSRRARACPDRPAQPASGSRPPLPAVECASNTCGGEADQISDLGDRVRGVLLKEGENLTVDGVHSENSISADKCGSAAVGRIISLQLRSFQLYLENYSIASQNRIGVPVAVGFGTHDNRSVPLLTTARHRILRVKKIGGQ